MFPCKEGGQGVAVGHIHLDKVEMRRKPRKAGTLETHVVVVIHIVDAHHFVAPFDQPLGDEIAYETCRSCNEYLHPVLIISLCLFPLAAYKFDSRSVGFGTVASASAFK